MGTACDTGALTGVVERVCVPPGHVAGAGFGFDLLDETFSDWAELESVVHFSSYLITTGSENSKQIRDFQRVNHYAGILLRK